MIRDDGALHGETLGRWQMVHMTIPNPIPFHSIWEHKNISEYSISQSYKAKERDIREGDRPLVVIAVHVIAAHRHALRIFRPQNRFHFADKMNEIRKQQTKEDSEERGRTGSSQRSSRGRSSSP